jgi:methionyl-tRNA synthetase
MCALKSNEKPEKFVEGMSKKFIDLWARLNISYDGFIRTTKDRHIEIVQAVFKKIYEKGDIYKGEYNGLYCVDCEAFYTEKDLKDGLCPIHGKKAENIKEESYFFKMSKYQERILEYIQCHEDFIQPQTRRNEIINRIKEGIRDLSVSRSSFNWGISLPMDGKHVIFVWFDALINYISGAPDFWPANIHILGKDNQRFHAIFWPAMLKSTGYELPKTILVHDFISLNGQKISKSLGNIIRPSELIEKFGVDAVRYYFLRYGPLTNDVDISIEKIQEVYNADLANGLGNLVARITQLAEQNLTKGTRPEPKGFPKEYTLAIENFELNKAIGFIWKKIQALDQKINETEPYKLVKEKPESGKKVIFELTQELYLIGRLLNPFLPETSAKIKEAVITNRKPKTLFPRLK